MGSRFRGNDGIKGIGMSPSHPQSAFTPRDGRRHRRSEGGGKAFGTGQGASVGDPFGGVVHRPASRQRNRPPDLWRRAQVRHGQSSRAHHARRAGRFAQGQVEERPRRRAPVKNGDARLSLTRRPSLCDPLGWQCGTPEVTADEQPDGAKCSANHNGLA